MEQNTKKNNVKKIIIIILILILLIGITTFFYLNTREKAQKESNVEEKAKKEKPTKEDKAKDNAEDKIESEISKKVNIIVTEGRDSEGIKIDNNTYFSLSLLSQYGFLTNDTLTDEDKINIALNSGNHTNITIPQDQIGLEEIKNGISSGMIYQQITDEEAKTQYQNLFSGTMIMSDRYGTCPGYIHDAINQVYYINRECGGTSVGGIYLYLSEFTKMEDESIRVLVTLAFSHGENIYKDIDGYNLASTNEKNEYLYKEKLDYRPDYSYITDFQIAEENKQDLKNYIFEFKKDENNNYYLSTITLAN